MGMNDEEKMYVQTMAVITAGLMYGNYELAQDETLGKKVCGEIVQDADELTAEIFRYANRKFPNPFTNKIREE